MPPVHAQRPGKSTISSYKLFGAMVPPGNFPPISAHARRAGIVTSIVVVLTDITDSACCATISARGKNGGGGAVGGRRRPRSKQSIDRDSRLRRSVTRKRRSARYARKDLRVILQEAQRTKTDRAEPAQLCPADAAAAQRGATEFHPAPHHAAASLRLPQLWHRHRGASQRNCPSDGDATSYRQCFNILKQCLRCRP